MQGVTLAPDLAAQVKETMGKFEERLWSIIRNFIVLGRANPALLVSAVRVVEMQETVDKQIAASGKCARETLAPALATIRPIVLSCHCLIKSMTISLVRKVVIVRPKSWFGLWCCNSSQVRWHLQRNLRPRAWQLCC